MVFLRRFSTSALAKAAFVARTTVTPQNGTWARIPTTIDAKSVIFLSTPQNLPATIENAISLHQKDGLQVVVAGVERTVPNAVSNGVSELWMDTPVQIGRSELLAEKDTKPVLRESDGINPVGAKVHWKTIEGNLNMDIQGTCVNLTLANTAFATGTLTTLFYFDNVLGLGQENMGQTLSSLHVKLPELAPRLLEPVSLDRWTPLTAGTELVVTKCTGNLVKGINNQPAAQYLEKNAKLMDIASKDTKVYVKVWRQEAFKKYEVIAGGGGWGAKADLLAISPEADLKKGDRLEFFMVTPTDRFAQQTAAVVSRQFLFECAPEATGYKGHDTGTSQTVEDLFGGGGEAGFSANGVNYRSAGELLRLAYGHST